MITGIPLEQHRSDWQKQMARAISDPLELLRRLGIDPRTVDLHEDTDAFPMRVPEAFIRRMRPGDINDPLLLQVLPLRRESITEAGFQKDPVGDLDAFAGTGLLQKYHGRALMISTQACAVHCRYCFRRHFPYQDNGAQQDDWSDSLSFLQEHQEAREIILSGGDPLSLSDQRLKSLIERLDEIPHLQRLRIHTRQPVVIPDRITRGLTDILKNSRLTTVIVLHINHPNEIDDLLRAALAQLTQTGISLLNQAVLLRGINDDLDTQLTLSEQLIGAGILPYYLHLLDRVEGATHFEVEEDKATELYQAMRGKLPGYLVPRMVREEAGKAFKTPFGTV
jgi:EF-P beta-lysylation protein EpmB